MRHETRLERYLRAGYVGPACSSAQTTRSPHVNKLCLFQVAVEEWRVTVAVQIPVSRVSVKSVLRDLQDELELLLLLSQWK